MSPRTALMTLMYLYIHNPSFPILFIPARSFWLFSLQLGDMADKAQHQVGDENEISSSSSTSIEEKEEEDAFPEGGMRAWLVASGCAGVLFSTLGFANSFG